MILLPTLNRLQKLETFMKAAKETETTTPGLVIVDHDDFAANLDEYKRLEAEAFPERWEIRLTNARGMGSKVREVFPDISHLPYVGLLNDDHLPITKHWDVKAIKQLNGKNFVSTNDRWRAPAMAAGLTIWSMPLLECVGYPIFPRQIEHLGIDDIWQHLGRATGCWRVAMDIVVEHQHAFLGAAADETHKLTYGEGPWQGSPAQQDMQARCNAWLQEAPQAIEKIKKFADNHNYFIKLNPQQAELHGVNK